MATLKFGEMGVIESALGMGSGFVLNFSDRTFGYFFDDLSINIDDEVYRENGSSKANRLRTFIKQSNEITVARALKALWNYRNDIDERYRSNDSPVSISKYQEIIKRLEDSAGVVSIDAIDRFSDSATLEELISAIGRDIDAGVPQAALDRLHTYCMKKFAHILQARGITCDHKDPLHSRVGKYAKYLETEPRVDEISRKIIKTQIHIFEEFNYVRNNKTFAHDNEIFEAHQAKFVFDSICNVLRFVQGIEKNLFSESIEQ